MPGMRRPGSARGRAGHGQRAGTGHKPKVRLQNENWHPLQPGKAAAPFRPGQSGTRAACGHETQTAGAPAERELASAAARKGGADACFAPETEVPGRSSLRDQRDGRILERFLVEDKTPLHLLHRLKAERGTGRPDPALPARAADNGGGAVRAADDAQHHGA